MHLYLDIETIPGQRPGLRDEIAAKILPPGSYKKPETIAAWEADEKTALVEEAFRKTSFDGSIGHVISIAFAVDDGRVSRTSVGNARPGIDDGVSYEVFRALEAQRLIDAFAIIGEELQALADSRVDHHLGPSRGYGYMVRGEWRDSRPPIGPVTVVAHHADFDLRFLYHRAVILGVPVPSWFPINPRPGSDAVYDTMTRWAGHGGRIGQDRLCEALGIPRGDDIKGSQVYDFWLAGGGAEIADHNVADVERLRAIHRRMTFWTPPEPVRDVAEGFYHRALSWIEDDGSLITAMRRALGDDVCEAVALAERRGHVTIEVLTDPSDSRIRLTENGRRRLRGLPNLPEARAEDVMSNEVREGVDHV
jgi:hypothetical protein